MTGKQTALATIDAGAYPVLREDAQGAVLAMQENLGGSEISPFDLDVITVPSGGGLAWVVPGLDGDESEKELEGIIVHHQPVRSFWKESFEASGGGTPPDCSSVDGRVGVGSPGGVCRACPLDTWGSGKGDAKACQERHMVFLLRPHEFLPVLVNVPPGSLKLVRKMLLRLTSKCIPFYDVVVALGLKQDKSSTGITYSQIAPRRVGAVGEDERERLAAYRDAIVPSLRAVKLDSEDFEATA